jgi:hypothetical protein
MVRFLQGAVSTNEPSAFNDFQSMTPGTTANHLGDTSTCSGEDNSTGATLHDALIVQR